MKDILYEGKGWSTGGRAGHAETEDGVLNLTITTPTALGGDGARGTNPEQLFAVGYAACFLSAMKVVGRQMKIVIPDETKVHCVVGIGRTDTGFGLRAGMTIHVPDVDNKTANEVVEKAHLLCPYSAATRGNIEVTFKVN